MCIAIIFSPAHDVINLKTNLSFLIKQFSYMTKEVLTSKLNILRITVKEIYIFRWNKKYFSSFFKGLSLKQINYLFLEDESQFSKKLNSFYVVNYS